ncbi:MAG: ABC transporter permease, partial [Acidobacteria bacterium]|nr:ABC transporter permease [Acidobacteriota bacterium]
MDRLFQDLKFSARTLRKSPGFALIAIVTLALGIGANTAAFSVIDAVLLRPLAYPESERLVQVYETDSAHGVSHGPISAYNFSEWQNQASAFEHMAAYEFDSFNYLAGNTAERMSGVMVSADFFRVLGVQPALGRDFVSREDCAGKAHAAILSY